MESAAESEVELAEVSAVESEEEACHLFLLKPRPLLSMAASTSSPWEVDKG